ncbi:hypothetical protein SLS60_004308 [Paraconiothyrium brasiliense]|uniref:Cytochrome P450 n=1 Tax=Paraconiothyrium brasiliense TaxID=300254 RepID=A0ABR3RKT3_9PLEO
MLSQLTPILLEEITHGFGKELAAGKPTSKGKEVTAMDFFSGIMHRAATRVMIGTELCRDESFLKTTTSMLQSIFFTAIITVNLPLGPLRPYLVPLLTLPHKWKNEKCAKVLQPIVEKRIQRRQSKQNGHSDGDIGDAIEWTLDLVKGDPKYDTPERLTEELLHNLWAASSAPGGMMTEIVYQMLTYPEYMEPLRKEAEQMVKEHGWTEKMLANLQLQDSFVREVNRMLPTGAKKPFEFSDGLTLPVGTRFGFPIRAMQHDSDNYESPDTFDGFRFFKKTQAENGNGGVASESSQRWSSTAMSSTNLAWGYGNHICPGRFFAIRAIKFILTKLLLEYEIGWDRPKGAERPKCVNVEGQFVPNLSQKVWIKARSQL